jgi:tRNA(Met) C34 N-acetyltransferase TmcA
MQIVDLKEDIKEKEKQLAEKEKEQLKRRKRMAQNDKTPHWRQLPKGYPEKMAADPAGAKKELQRCDDVAYKQIRKQLGQTDDEVVKEVAV